MILRERQCYLGLLTRLPLYLPKRPLHVDTTFDSLIQAVAKTLAHKRVHNYWIPEET